MASNELRNKTELTSVTGDEWVYVQENASPYTVKKVSITRVQQSGIIGKSLMYLNSYIPISATFPWLCLSLSDRTLTTTNYSTDFIDEMRSRKIVYDETDTVVSSFSGSWSGSDFTLDNNDANRALVEELAEDWLFASLPTNGWRILVANGVEYDITNIVASTRIITVSGSPSGTSIEIYMNRVKGSTTSCKHFSEAGLASYQAGIGKINGLRRRDKAQEHLHITPLRVDTGSGTSFESTTANYNNVPGGTVASTKSGKTLGMSESTGSGAPRTGPKTEVESGTDFKYLYVGSYLA